MDDLKHDLEMARREMRSLVDGVQRLEGTFASIERHLVKLFEHDAQTQARLEQMEARIEALEKRQPPAA